MINSFTGRYRFLSNFYILQYPIHWRGINYPSSEHFYQAMKTTDFLIRLDISKLLTPGEVKKYGRITKLRKDWDSVKDIVMETGLMLKFAINLDIAIQLMETGNMTLIEGNTWHDNYWGDCQCAKCVKWPGLNKLGQMLMSTREKLITIG